MKWVSVTQSWPNLWDTIDCSPPGSSVHGILQARILERVAMPSSRGSFQPRIEPRSPTLQMDSLPSEPPRKPKNTGVGSRSLLQQIFLTQESNQGLLPYRWILYCLSQQGSPRILEWVGYPFSRGSSQPRNPVGVSCIAGRFLISWATREAQTLFYHQPVQEWEENRVRGLAPVADAAKP